MTTLYLQANSWSESTRDADTDDGWDRGDTYTSWDFLGVSLSKNNRWAEYHESLFDISVGDAVFCVVARYSTGDTFGSDDNCSLCFLEICKTKEEAQTLRSELMEANQYSVTINGIVYHIPWLGYFENLNDIEVLEFVVAT